MDHCFDVVSDQSGKIQNSVSMAESQTLDGDSDDMTKMLQKLQESAHFVVRKLKPSHVANDTSCAHCTLTIPVGFVKEHSDRIQEIVNLRSKVCAEPMKVSLNIYNRRPSSPDTLLGNGWKAFAIRNELSVGDSLIFELIGVSEFEVHIFRGGKSTSSPEQFRKGASKKRKTGGGFEKQESSVSVEMKRDDSENSLNIESMLNNMEIRLTHMENRLTHMENRLMNVEKTENGWSVKEEERPPSFVQRLELRNVQDAVGNTCGACFEIPVGFVKTLQIKQLWLGHDTHVKLQGIQEGSPVRAVTCAYKITQLDMKEFDNAARTMSGLSLGWGDFVRENGLRAGIDKVAGVLETNRPDAKNVLYQATFKQGDFLLNRIQKLSRVIDL